MTGDTPKGRHAGMALRDAAIDWLVHLHSGRATSAEHAAFRAWRGRSPAHESAAREADVLWRDLGRTRMARGHASRSAVAPAAIQADSRSQDFDRGSRLARRGSLTRRRVLMGGIAASLAVAAVGSGFVGPLSGLMADYATRTGERRKIRLPDGSLALLNTATALSMDYTAGERRLTLHAGEAQFEVRPEPGRPFVVTAGNGEAQALGTVFSVRHDDSGSRVVVSEGVVEVRFGDRVSARLGAGRQVSYGADISRLDPEPADLAAATAWTRGKLVFNKRPLSEVVAELERYHAGRILILDDKLKGLKVSGVFDLDDPDGGLRAIERALQLSITQLPLLTLIR